MTCITVDIRHHRRVRLTWAPEQMTEYQRKVTKIVIKINSQVQITRFTQFDQRYNKQGNMINFRRIIPEDKYRDIILTRCLG